MKKGAVLIEVLIALFITSVVFITVYTTIGISLINTNYLKEARKSADFVSQLSEAFSACAESNECSMFDYIKEKQGSVAGVTEIDMAELNSYMASVPNGESFLELIDENNMTDYNVQLFLISPNAVYLSENSLGTPFGSGIYTPNEDLMTFELRIQMNSKDWGNTGYSIYRESRPAVISYIFQINRG